jgi:hypothetical protein
MRHVVVTASLCLLTFSSAIAADQKLYTDRFDADKAPVASPMPDPSVTESVRAKTPASATQLDKPTFEVAAANSQIEIPEQSDTSALLAPRDLPLPEPKPQPKPVVHHTTDELCDRVTEAAQNNNLPVPFFIRLLFQESKFKPDAVSHSGAQGIAQIMPATADALGLDNPFDPFQAIPASARLLRNLFEKFGNLGLAAAAYNAGPKRIHDWLARKGKLPEETQGYVKVITGRAAEKWKGTRAAMTARNLPPHAPCQDAPGVMIVDNEIPVPEERPENVASAEKPEREAKKAARASHRTHVAHAAQKAEKKVAAAPASRKSNGKSKSTVNLAARRHARPSKHRVAMR